MKFFFNGGSYPELVKTLQDLGHDVIDHDACWLHHINKNDKGKKYNGILRDAIQKHKPDVYLCTKCMKDNFRVYEDTHKFVQKNSGITVYWSQDDPFFMPKFMQNRLYTGLRVALTCSTSAFRDYKSAGMTPYLFWPAFDRIVRTFSPVKERDKIDFTFVGTPYTCTDIPRRDLVGALLDSGITNIELYGSSAWKSTKFSGSRTSIGIQGGKRLADLYRGMVPWGKVHLKYAQARLNLSNHVVRAEAYLNDRVPMVLGVGAFLFLDRSKVLEKEFIHEEDVVYYTGKLDFIKKAKYYIGKPRLREKIGQSGRKKVLERHTYEARAHKLLRILSQHGIK